MKMALCTVAICLTLIITFSATRETVRKEARLTRNAVGGKGAEGVADDGTGNENLYGGLEVLGNQLAVLNRRMTTLEDAVNTSDRVAHETALRRELQALREELKAVSTVQSRLVVLPGFMADLTRYLERSFEHVEKSVTPNTALEALAANVDEVALKIENVQTFFVPLYQSLGLAEKGDHANQTPVLLSVLNEKLDKLVRETSEVRSDIEALRKWMTKRNLEPGEHP